MSAPKRLFLSPIMLLAVAPMAAAETSTCETTFWFADAASETDCLEKHA